MGPIQFTIGGPGTHDRCCRQRLRRPRHFASPVVALTGFEYAASRPRGQEEFSAATRYCRMVPLP